MWYTVALFVHILGAIGLFVAVSLIVIALVHMRKAVTLEQVREWAAVAQLAGKSLAFIGGFCQNSEYDLAGRSLIAYDCEKQTSDEESSMNCPHCTSPSTKEQREKPSSGIGYSAVRPANTFFMNATSTPFKYLEYPTDIVLLTILWRLRYKLSLHDVAEMFLERGWTFTHEAVRDWETRCAPLLADQLRKKRQGQAGKSC